MTAWMGEKLGQIFMVAQGGLVVAAVLFIGHVWWRTKALVPTVGAMLLAGAVLWGTANIQWFQKAVLEQLAGR
jgi:hypothetical protein